MSTQATRWFGMRLTPREKKKIERLAEREGASQKEAVLDAVEEQLRRREKPFKATPGSVLEGIEDLVGSIGDENTPRDLASNKKYLEDLGQSSMSPRVPREQK